MSPPQRAQEQWGAFTVRCLRSQGNGLRGVGLSRGFKQLDAVMTSGGKIAAPAQFAEAVCVAVIAAAPAFLVGLQLKQGRLTVLATCLALLFLVTGQGQCGQHR